MYNIHVVSEMVLPSEAFVAVFTWKWSFVRVSSNVDQQIVGLRELSTARRAVVLLLRPVISIKNKHIN